MRPVSIAPSSHHLTTSGDGRERVERLGVFGGTFDPPHIGHLVIAVNVLHALRLDRMLMVVANVPWQKTSSRTISPAKLRLEMVEAAVSGVAGLEPSDIEVRRGGESFTADTLCDLHDEDPTRELFVVLGADAAAGLDTWARIEEVRAHSTLVVVDRPGEQSFVAGQFGLERVEAPRLEVSSSDLRSRVTDGRPLDFLLTPEVISCIERLGLYRVAG